MEGKEKTKEEKGKRREGKGEREGKVI